MNTSEQINEIAAALSKAQGVMEGAAKDAANPFFKSKYADLASVWEACRKALTSNGLCVVQTPTADGPKVSVETMLAHTSGQWIKDILTAEAKDASPQAVGSTITYLRRYALQSIAGVAPEDDDGEAAQGRNATPAGQTFAKRPEPTKTEPARPKDSLTDAEIEQVGTLAKKAGYAKFGDIKPLLVAIGGVDALRMLDRRYLPELISNLERKVDETVPEPEAANV